MKLLALLSAVVFFAVSCSPSVPTPVENPVPPHAPGIALVKFKTPNEGEIERIIDEAGADALGRIPRIHVWKVKATKGQSAVQLVERFRRHPRVEFAEVDGLYRVRIVPNDPRFPEQWAPPKINAPQAWDVSTGSPQWSVANLDTGVDYNHPDLAGKVIKGPDYINGDADPMDDEGHGTETSGVATAIGNNAIGVAGIDWQARILAIKVCNSSGWCSWSASASGITYAADNGARVINMSFGGSSSSGTLQSAVQYAWKKGVVMACSAGNNGGPVMYPAAYPECIAVGATDSGDNRVGFSAYGPELEVMAPGTSILTTGRGGGYVSYSGTSYSAPHVAGLASLVFARNPSLTNSQVRDILRSTAKDLGDAGWDQYYGWGRIDAYAAVLAATTPPPPPPTPTPTPTPAPTPPPPPDNPPTVRIILPTEGSTVSGRVEIVAEARDDIGIARVEFWVDDERVGTSTSAPYSTMWNTKPKKWAAGPHTIRAVAYDTAGQTAEHSITVILAK